MNAQAPGENPLAKVMWDYWKSDRPHHERMILTAAVISTALQKEGMRATLVGGGAIELHAPGVYRTSDIDLVVEGRSRHDFGAVFESLGLQRSGRHWVREDLYVEVPAVWLDVPAESIQVGPYELHVTRKEWSLGERIAGFRHWKYWASGIEAISMMRAFGGDLDEAELKKSLRVEGTTHAYRLLRELADTNREVTVEQLAEVWHRHYR